ncbi:uncharacterized protein LOC107867346 isoform X1 [Capsicum annuum]|uniref:uncharacterized protein LOC107867346 isoform X1 n=1 Tax=Capsicum annuum TaxID=4072 RepID=UPI001FB164BB|nr:uncharacterized protein LOC107867346 isoform X1 [Capsicum annuum]
MESHSLSSSLTIRAKSLTQPLPPRRSFNVQANPNKYLSVFPSPIMPVLTYSRRPLQIHRRNASFTRRRNSNSSWKFYARVVGGDSGRISDVTRELIVLNSALTLVLGVANRVLYKLALVPMKEYPFFLAQVTTFGNASFTRRRNLNSSRKFYVRAVGGDSGRISDVTTELIVLNSALTLVLGVANQVLYKLALVPMKEYPFFLAQVTTFGYLAIYLSILYARYRAGIVTKEMVAYPKSRFLLIGLLEALGVVCGMYAGAVLPGPAIPILSQTFLVWQLTLSVFILGRTYSLNQIAGCLLVAAGVVLAVTSGSDSNQMLTGIAFVWPVLMVASSAFQAAASVIKEFVFIDAASRLKGKVLDIFVVNSFGSGFQLCRAHPRQFYRSREEMFTRLQYNMQNLFLILIGPEMFFMDLQATQTLYALLFSVFAVAEVIAGSIVVVRMTLHTVDNGYSIAIYVFTFMLHTPSVPFYLTPILRIVFSNYFSNFLKSREIFCIFTFLPLVLNNNIH